MFRRVCESDPSFREPQLSFRFDQSEGSVPPSKRPRLAGESSSGGGVPVVGATGSTSHAMVPFDSTWVELSDESSEEEENEPLQRKRKLGESSQPARRTNSSQVVSSEDEAPSQEPSESSFDLPILEATPPQATMPPVFEEYARNPGKRPMMPSSVPDVVDIPSRGVSIRPVPSVRREQVPPAGLSQQEGSSSSLPCLAITTERLKLWQSQDDHSRREKVGHDLNEVCIVPLPPESFS